MKTNLYRINEFFFNRREFFCPFCSRESKKWFSESHYLATVFSDIKTLWFANMVMHYRHKHTEWDNIHRIMNFSQERYKKEKELQNDKAKHYIIKRGQQFLIDNKFILSDITCLEGIKSKTIKYFNEKIISNKSSQTTYK